MFIRRSICPRDQCECFSFIGMTMVSSVVMSRFFVFLLFNTVQVSIGLFVVALSDALIQRTRWFPFIALMAVWFRKASIILSFRNLAVVSTIVALFCRCPLVRIAASIRETFSCPLRMTCCILCALCVPSCSSRYWYSSCASSIGVRTSVLFGCQSCVVPSVEVSRVFLYRR